jgi:two-component system osmolarity sensor histidine kinase EnvZ
MLNFGKRSLVWRLGTLALTLTVLSLVLHMAVMTVWLGPFGDRLVGQIAARAKLTRSLLQATPAAAREQVRISSSDRDFRLEKAPGVGPHLSALPFPVGSLLSDSLGSEFQVRRSDSSQWTSSARSISIAFLVDGEHWQVHVLVDPPLTALLTTGIGWLLLAAAAVAASFVVGSRFIVRPIEQIAERIADQGEAIQGLAVPSGASSEVRSLVDSFNRLADRVQTADRTKQQMLAGVSHDLRTPLARLRLRIETQCEPAVAEAAEPELRAVERIVSQFLAYVHGDAGHAMAAQADLLNTVDKVLAAYSTLGIEIALVSDGGAQPMAALEVERVVNNLVDNALAYGQQPISVQWRTSADGACELGVWDKGAGLTAAQFEAALEPFVRLSKDSAIGHCGLGLAIVAQVAHQWQADLSCRHEASGGFGVELRWRPAALGERP